MFKLIETFEDLENVLEKCSGARDVLYRYCREVACDVQYDESRNIKCIEWLDGFNHYDKYLFRYNYDGATQYSTLQLIYAMQEGNRNNDGFWSDEQKSLLDRLKTAALNLNYKNYLTSKDYDNLWQFLKTNIDNLVDYINEYLDYYDSEEYIGSIMTDEYGLSFMIDNNYEYDDETNTLRKKVEYYNYY